MRKSMCVLWSVGLVVPLIVGCAATAAVFPPGPLPACPDSPNCVSSADSREAHHVAPLTYQGDWRAARDRLVALLKTQKRTRVVAVEERFVHAECRSMIFRFVDDLTFYFEPERHEIEVRSAARTGYSDFGVNRKRVEEIRRLWEKREGPATD